MIYAESVKLPFRASDVREGDGGLKPTLPHRHQAGW
jgi:hypothetical protein